MTATEIQGYIQIGVTLVNVIGTTYDQAKNVLSAVKKRLHPNMTDAEMNAILDGVAEDALRRKALAEADARAAEALTATSAPVVAGLEAADQPAVVADPDPII